jgi:hypothetical protein
MPGLLRGMARTAVIAGTATAVSNNVTRRQAARYASQDAQQYQEEMPPANDMTTQLQELAQLKDQGILTQAEFDAKKKQILGI